ncbi:hypothetical protein QBC35DRAFT_446865 [Podospora australis]|uniref:Uncharacterized protein n=1 Tax=Podospora australis TaxID=1536484 RepID=A0AAN7ANB6_9PEZI|nr:hypothetical protein QBC35DRAFT_446865 [Podospora australis]
MPAFTIPVRDPTIMPVITVLGHPTGSPLKEDQVDLYGLITPCIPYLFAIVCIVGILLAIYEGLIGSWARVERMRIARAERLPRTAAVNGPPASFFDILGDPNDNHYLGLPCEQTPLLLSVNSTAASYRSMALSGSTQISPFEEAEGSKMSKFLMPPSWTPPRKSSPQRRSSFS